MTQLTTPARATHFSLVFNTFLLTALFSTNCWATDFTTNFESTNVRSVQDFTVTNNGLSASFSGGTSFTIGNRSLYHSGTKSWMLDPAGSTSRGTSTGEGTITLSSPASALDFYIRTSNANSTGQVQIIDETQAIIEDITNTIVNGSWLRIQKTLNEGDALITSITVRAFGSDMLAIDDLSFSTSSTTDNEDDSSENNADATDESQNSDSGGGTLYWLLMILTGFILKANRR